MAVFGREVLCFCISAVMLAEALYLPLGDSKNFYPLLVDPDTGSVYKWSSGRLARFGAASAGVRLSDKGIRFVHHTHTLRRLLTGIPVGSGGRSSRGGWFASQCTPGSAELCTADSANTVLFPLTSSRVLVSEHIAAGMQTQNNTASAASPLQRALRALAEDCKRHAGRSIVSEPASGSNGSADAAVPVYTASLCDITQKGLEFVYDSNVLFVRHDDTSWIFFAVLCVCMIVLVTALAQNIARLLGDQVEPPNNWPGLLASAVLMISVLASSGKHLEEFVTVEDMWVYIFCITYVAFYLVMWVTKWCMRCWKMHLDIMPQADTPVSVFVGSLMLGVLRLYNGAECAYVLPVLFLACTRAMYKSVGVFLASSSPGALAAVRKHEFTFFHTISNQKLDTRETSNLPLVFIEHMFRTSLVMDFVMVGLMHQFAFRPLFYEPLQGDLYFLVIAAVTFSVAHAGWASTLRHFETADL